MSESDQSIAEAAKAYSEATKSAPGSLTARSMTEPVLSRNASSEVEEIDKGRSAKPLEKLSPKHHKVIFLHLQGIRTTDIAQELGMTVAWCSTILNDPLSQEIIQEHHATARKELLALSEEAVNVQRNALKSKDERNRLKASETVLKANNLIDGDADSGASVKDMMGEALKRIAQKAGSGKVRLSETTRTVEIGEDDV